MENYDGFEKTLDENLNISLEYVAKTKEQVFSELRKSGLSEDEIEEIIDIWCLRKMWPNGEVIKKGILALQGVAASLHLFEKLSRTATQKTATERLVFKECLADLGAILVFLGDVVAYKEGIAARKNFGKNLEGLLKQIAESEKYVKEKTTKKAVETRRNMSRKRREMIISFYDEIRKNTPGISKERAARLIYDDPEKNQGLSQVTIRKYLCNQ